MSTLYIDSQITMIYIRLKFVGTLSVLLNTFMSNDVAEVLNVSLQFLE